VLGGSIREERPWLDLNTALGDDEALVTYARAVANNPRAREGLEYQDHRAFERLTAAGEWEIAGRMYEDPVDRFYVRKTPPVLAPLEGAAQVTVGVLTAPYAIVFGSMMVSDFPGQATPRKFTPEEIRAHEMQHLRKAAVQGVALVAAGRTGPASELYRRAKRNAGNQETRAMFAEVTDQAGLSIDWEGVQGPPERDVPAFPY
jgi:hypothetical protein